MIKKADGQNKNQRRIRHSLNIKTFLIMIALVLGMGGTILVAGFLTAFLRKSGEMGLRKNTRPISHR